MSPEWVANTSQEIPFQEIALQRCRGNTSKILNADFLIDNSLCILEKAHSDFFHMHSVKKSNILSDTFYQGMP